MNKQHLRPDDLPSFKYWREKYKFLLRAWDRKRSEERIDAIEEKVKANILSQGSLSYKDVLLEIRWFKFGPRDFGKKKFAEENSESSIREKVDSVIELVDSNPDDAGSMIEILSGLEYVGIAVASAILRFLGLGKHRYGVIDKNVAGFCSQFGLTNFELGATGLVLSTPTNIKEYSIFCSKLYNISSELRKRRITFQSIQGEQRDFDPVDVEMAIFAYCTQTRGIHDQTF